MKVSRTFCQFFSAAAGIDSMEHGFELDEEVARQMAAAGTFLVSTLAVPRSFLTFAGTTRIERFSGTQGRKSIEEEIESSAQSVRIAHAAGVRIAAGTDFGGGSLRANQMAWEIESLVAAGLQPHEAVAAATWRGGELRSKGASQSRGFPALSATSITTCRPSAEMS